MLARKHYKLLAQAIAQLPSRHMRLVLANVISPELAKDNERFDLTTFHVACRLRAAKDVHKAYDVQCLYSNKWETVTTSDTRKEAKQLLLDYSENEPDYRHRIKVHSF